jgi:hypothetical protein
LESEFLVAAEASFDLPSKAEGQRVQAEALQVQFQAASSKEGEEGQAEPRRHVPRHEREAHDHEPQQRLAVRTRT